MSGAWNGLLQNLAILAIAVSIWMQLADWIDRRAAAVRASILVALAAGTTIGLMSLPFTLDAGVIADLRAVPIALSGFLFGPVVGIPTGLLAAAYRLILGGTGALGGVLGITVVSLVATVGYILLKGRAPTSVEMVLFALVTAICNFAGFLVLPPDIMTSVVSRAGPPVFVFVFTAALGVGLAIIDNNRRRETARENRALAGIIDALPDPLNAKDLEGRFIAANLATAKLMGADSSAALIGHTDFDFYPPDTAARFRADEEMIMIAGSTREFEQGITRADGTTTWLLTVKVPLKDAAGKIVGLLTHNRNINERKRLRDEVARSRKLLDDALANMADALVLYDREDRLVFCNEQYRQMFSRTAHLRLPGTPLADILRASVESGEQAGVAPHETEEWIAAIVASLRTAGELEIQLGDGRWLHSRVRPMEDGGSLTVISDITRIKQAEAALARANARLAQLADTDGLTGLMNRRAFDEALHTEISRSQRTRAPMSLMLIDVDRFKAYNDTYGHPAGDVCLKALSRCLKKVLRRPSDVTARYGGEELVALMPDTPPEGALHIAEAFRRAVYDLDLEHTGSEKGRVTVSIGVAALLGGPAKSSRDLVRMADEALYRAKGGGRDRVCAWQPAQESSLRVVGQL